MAAGYIKYMIYCLFQEMENEHEKIHKQITDKIAQLSLMIDQLKEENKKLIKYNEKHTVSITLKQQTTYVYMCMHMHSYCIYRC